MRGHRWRGVLIGASLFGCTSGSTPPAPPAPAAPPPAMPQAGVLGRYPLCEASGALFTPCSDAGGRCLLVADNENDDALFLFDVAGERLSGQRPLPLMRGETPIDIKDAEGLSPFHGGIFVLGSHSRRSWDKAPPRCTRDPKRLVFAALRRTGDRFETQPVRTDAARWERLLQPDPCRRELFVPAHPDGRAIAASVCDAIAAADPHAETSSGACWGSLNFEGVAALPDAGGERIWFGLRSPVPGGHAVLVRLASADALRFDAATALDLGAAGVRDLATADGWLWVLAGTSGDYMQPASLWRLPATAVRDGARLRPERIVSLPPFSEALAIDAGGDAVVLVDGDYKRGEPRHQNGCPTPARYLFLRLPTSS